MAALFSGLHWTNELRIGDGKWLFVAAPITGGQKYSEAWVVLIAGFLFSSFIGAHFLNSGRYALSLQKANSALDTANQQLQAQNTRFDTALNNMSQGLVMFDASERLVICNDLYIRMYGLSPKIVNPGCSLRELVLHGVEMGGSVNDPEQFRVNLLESLAQWENHKLYQ